MISMVKLIAFVAQALCVSAVLISSAESDARANCRSDVIKTPPLFGAEVVSMTANVTSNFQGLPGNDVCFVVVTITHPGTGDRVNNFIALPLSSWNGKFQGVGGGGYAGGSLSGLASAAMAGFSAATTDTGHDMFGNSTGYADSWALVSPGNVNQYLLLNFARRSLHDMTVLGKGVSQSFYGSAVEYSYWNGCSTGGRQGLVMAQYYPEDYDGILAEAPAIQWNDFTMAQQWLYTVENNENYAPPPCEFDAAVAAAIRACDAQDGLVDGIISALALCDFEMQSLVGQSYSCNGTTRTWTQKSADVIDKMWQGPRTPSNEFLWWGLPRGANFSSLAPNEPGNPVPQPMNIADSWVRGMLAKNLTFDTAAVSYKNFSALFLQGHIEYDSIMGDFSPDLRAFKQRGGKIITWQGLADNFINPQGTMHYYNKILALDPSAADFYRQFYSPGVGHCGGGIGVTPTNAIGQLQDWVQRGIAPTYLEAASEYPVNASTAYPVNGTNVRFMDLCTYPLVNKYGGGDPAVASSWHCVAHTGWEHFPVPLRDQYSCVGGPGWY